METPLSSSGWFSTYAKIQKLERSTRTIFKRDERSNLSPSQLSPAAFRRAWWGWSFPLHGSLRTPDTRTSSDLMDVPAFRSGHRSFYSSILSLHVAWTRNEYIARLTRPTYHGFLGLLHVFDASRPLMGAGPSRFLELRPFPLPLGRPISGIPPFLNYPGWIPPNSTLLGPLGMHAQNGGIYL